MNLIEKYALDCGLNPESLRKPELYYSFVPLEAKNIITISTTTELSDPYPYFQDVVDKLLSCEALKDFQIIQLGVKDDQILDGCKVMCGNLTLGQLTYVLSESKLHIGNPCSYHNLCGALEPSTPTLGIYRKGQFEAYGTIWDKWKHAIVDWKDKIPSPDEVVKNILAMLSIKQEVEAETIFIGDKYPRVTVDVVPDLAVTEEFMEGMPINMRFDLLDTIDENHIKNAIITAVKRKVVFVTDKMFDTALIKEHKAKMQLVGLIFNLKKEHLGDEAVIEYCARVRKMGIKVILAVIKDDFTTAQINQFRLDFMDVAPINEADQTKASDLPLDKISENTVFKSSRLIFSNRKMYLSKQAYKEGAATNGQRFQKLSSIKDLTSLGKELEYSYIYNEK